MNEHINAALAARRERNLDQPDLADHATAQIAWRTWTPVEGLLELPREAEELIDAASTGLGHLHGTGGQRRHAWECAEAAAWGLARPQPQRSKSLHEPEGGLG